MSTVSSYTPLQLFFQDRASKKPQKKLFPLRKIPKASCCLASSCQHSSNISPAPGTSGEMGDKREEGSSDDSPWSKNDASGQETWQWSPLHCGHSKSPCLQHPVTDRALCVHKNFHTCSPTGMPVALERSRTANTSFPLLLALKGGCPLGSPGTLISIHP